MMRFLIAAVLYLQLQSPAQQIQPGAITGRLLSPKGTPESGVRIAAVAAAEVEKTGGTSLLGISLTDTDGRYRLEGLPPGRYYIFAGLIDLPSYYPNATSIDRATAVEVDAGVTLSGVDFTMARPSSLSVSGRITVPPTMQVSDSWTIAMTPLNPQNRGAGNALQSRIARDGSFEFARVSPGEYSLTSNVRGSTPLSLRVAEADLTNITVPMVDCNSGVVVKGRLVGTPQSPISTITLTGSRFGCTALTTPAPDGTFTFTNVPEGTYQLQLSPAPLGWASVPLAVEKVSLESVDVPLPVLIAVRGSATVEGGSPFPRTARGTSVPIQAVRINGREVVTSSIQDDGTFELRLPQGRYRLSISGLPAAYYLKAMTSGTVALSSSSFDVSETAPVDLHLTLGLVRRSQPKGVRVTGRVTFPPTGALPRSEGVLLVSAAGGRNAAVLEAPLAPDGSFEFTDVSPGTYNIETYPDNPAALYGVVVNREDVGGIEFVLPILVKVKGDIEWPTGSGTTPTPRPVSVQFIRREGTRVFAWGTLAQSDEFHFYLPEGDYRFSVTDIPPSFELGSVNAGDANVMEDGLRIRSDAEVPSLRVTLRGK